MATADQPLILSTNRTVRKRGTYGQTVSITLEGEGWFEVRGTRKSMVVRRLSGGRYWIRTSDFHRVKMALYR
jgi:hypothetical protein